MDILQAIEKRTSVREFQDRSVPRSIVESLVDAGRRAPSAMNIQPVEFVVVTDKKTKSTLASVTDFGKFIKMAPVCFAVFAKETKYYLEDGCAAVENILLAAAGLELGACWVAGDKKPFAADINKLLGVPAFFKLIALVPVGYPKHPPSPRGKRDLADVIHWERY